MLNCGAMQELQPIAVSRWGGRGREASELCFRQFTVNQWCEALPGANFAFSTISAKLTGSPAFSSHIWKSLQLFSVVGLTFYFAKQR